MKKDLLIIVTVFLLVGVYTWRHNSLINELYGNLYFSDQAPAGNHAAALLTHEQYLSLGWVEEWTDNLSFYPNHSFKKNPGVVRIGIFGGSHAVSGGGTKERDFTYPGLLQEKFRSQGFNQVEVINFGARSYGMSQEYMLWDFLGRKYGLDYVIFTIHDNAKYRDTSFVDGGRDHLILHGRYILDQGRLRFIPLAGDSMQNAYKLYHRGIPPLRYLLYDKEIPFGLKIFLPESLYSRVNPFYYRHDRDEDEEDILIYAGMLENVARHAKQVIIVANQEDGEKLLKIIKASNIHVFIPPVRNFEFQAGEFDGSMTPEGVLRALKTGSGIDIPVTDTPVRSLNKLLEKQDLYKAMKVRPEESLKFINRVDRGQPLSPFEITALNRILIEVNYPLETPTWQDIAEQFPYYEQDHAHHGSLGNSLMADMFFSYLTGKDAWEGNSLQIKPCLSSCENKGAGITGDISDYDHFNIQTGNTTVADMVNVNLEKFSKEDMDKILPDGHKNRSFLLLPGIDNLYSAFLLLPFELQDGQKVFLSLTDGAENRSIFIGIVHATNRIIGVLESAKCKFRSDYYGDLQKIKTSLILEHKDILAQFQNATEGDIIINNSKVLTIGFLDKKSFDVVEDEKLVFLASDDSYYFKDNPFDPKAGTIDFVVTKRNGEQQRCPILFYQMVPFSEKIQNPYQGLTQVLNQEQPKTLMMK